MRKPTKAIITDAGYASRYLPIAKTIPKGMLPIGNRPIMQLVVEECVAADIREIIIVATPEGKPIYEDYFNNAVNHIRKQLVAQHPAALHVPDPLRGAGRVHQQKPTRGGLARCPFSSC